MATEQLTLISTYKDVWDKTPTENTIETFLNGIVLGNWQDVVLQVRRISDKKERAKAKQAAPLVTVSGAFTDRTDAGIKKHSGFIAIDIDNIQDDVNTVKSLFISDPYVYAAFISISGKGLCLIFKIDGERHRDAFDGIGHYIYETYQLAIDPSCKNVSRARFVSYDIDLYSNPKALKFKKYLPKPKAQKINKVVYVKSDFDAIIKEFYDRNINICEDYNQWISVGHALNSQFPNSQEGRDYFHTLSSISSRYNQQQCDDVYSKIVQTASDDKSTRATIGSIYYYAKINGIQTYSEQTRQIISSTATLKRSGISSNQIAENLLKFEGIPLEQSQDIVNQAFAKDIEIASEESIICEVERWLKYNCELKRNAITRRIYNYGKPLDTNGFNSIFIAAKKAIDKLDFNLFERIILSDYTPDYNPFLEFFEAYKERNETGLIDQLAGTITTKNSEFAKMFFKKWLVGAISSVHGYHSPLMYILAGSEQNTGKTQFWRRLLPKELRSYYAESKLDAGKDDEILMTSKWVIMDDEMGGKSKQESKRLKDLTSKQTFSLREPYGRSNVDLERIAVLCGTTNDLAILNDPTGNRRLIPIEVMAINHAVYNSIDKVDLIMEAYHLYKSGYEWELTKSDIEYLNANTEKFEDYSLEFEMIQKYLKLPDHESHSMDVVEMTATEILNYMSSTSGNSKLSLKKVGSELKRIGFNCEIKKVNKKTTQIYRIIKSDGNYITQPNSEPAPF